MGAAERRVTLPRSYPRGPNDGARCSGRVFVRGATGLAARLLGFAFALLAGCSPEFNWREVRIEPGGFQVLMPSKAEQLTRQVPLGDEALSMHMTGSRVGPVSFTVTVVELASATEEASALALDRMEQAMLRNIGGRVLERSNLSLTPSAVALGMRAQGQAQGKPIMMWARFFRWQDYAVQAVVLGGEADGDKAETFFGSLRLPP